MVNKLDIDRNKIVLVENWVIGMKVRYEIIIVCVEEIYKDIMLIREEGGDGSEIRKIY